MLLGCKLPVSRSKGTKKVGTWIAQLVPLPSADLPLACSGLASKFHALRSLRTACLSKQEQSRTLAACVAWQVVGPSPVKNCDQGETENRRCPPVLAVGVFGNFYTCISQGRRTGVSKLHQQWHLSWSELSIWVIWYPQNWWLCPFIELRPRPPITSSRNSCSRLEVARKGGWLSFKTPMILAYIIPWMTRLYNHPYTANKVLVDWSLLTYLEVNVGTCIDKQ